MEVLLLPVGNCQEHGDDQCGEQLQVVGVDSQYADNELYHHVVNHSANAYCNQLQSKIPEQLAKDHFTNDNGGKTNNNSTSTLFNISISL